MVKSEPGGAVTRPGFRARLEADMVPQWRPQHVRFKKLRKRLRALQLPLRSADLESFEEDAARVERMLAADIERVVLWYLEVQGGVAAALRATAARRKLSEKEVAKMSADDLAVIRQLADEYVSIAGDMESLLQFAETNTRAVRKLLKLFDKRAHRLTRMQLYASLRNALPAAYVSNNGQSVSSMDPGASGASNRLRPQNWLDATTGTAAARNLELFSYHGGVTALIGMLATALGRLVHAEETILARGELEDLHLSRQVGLRAIAENMLMRLAVRQSRLRERTSRFVRTLAAQAGIFSDDEDQADLSFAEAQRRFETSELSLALNLCSTALFIISYYVILPTVGEYSAFFGTDRSTSGLIVGGTPFAGLASSVLYSWWSNSGFRVPILFASSCCMIGNFLYALGYTFRHGRIGLHMVIAGRMLIGFGGARAINRRYIADNACRSELVQRSADFVATSAVAMAAGPALSSLFTLLPSGEVFGLGFLPETNPAWILSVAWFFFVLVLWYCFEDGRTSDDFCIPSRGPDATEQTPLLTASREPGPLREPPTMMKSASSANRSTLLCLWIFFILKLVGEAMTMSAALHIPHAYGWSGASVGIFLALLGTLMFPSNLMISKLATRFEDTEQLYMFQGIMVLGCILMLPIFGHTPVSLQQYVLAAVLIFISTNVVEATCMSIMARVMPKSLSRGTLNSGLLSTEAGMLGRFFGDANVATVGHIAGQGWLLAGVFGPAVLASAVTLWVSWSMRDELDGMEGEDASESSDGDKENMKLTIANTKQNGSEDVFESSSSSSDDEEIGSRSSKTLCEEDL